MDGGCWLLLRLWFVSGLLVVFGFVSVCLSVWFVCLRVGAFARLCVVWLVSCLLLACLPLKFVFTGLLLMSLSVCLFV